MYDKLCAWIDEAFSKGIPEGVISVCFNLYEDADNTWSIEIVGCSSFDKDDTDWACDEVTDFATRDNSFSWEEETTWDNVLSNVTSLLNQYITEGNMPDAAKSLDGVAVGFVDGDLNILIEKE